MHLHNVLFLCHEFPPQNTGGAHRPFRFARQMKNHGYFPIVLTIENEEIIKNNPSISQTENLEEMTIIRTKIQKANSFNRLSNNYYFTILDDEGNRWKKELFKSVDQAIKAFSPTLVFVTLPPFSIGPLALSISKNYNLPLVIDWRDAWSNWNVSPYASKWHYLRTKKIEARLLKSADVNITTSHQTSFDFQNTHLDLPKSSFRVIHNSFEGERNLYSFDTDKKKKKIGYVGSFYYNSYSQFLINSPFWKKKPYQYFQFVPRKENWLYRTPYFFFKTLSTLRQSDPNLSSKLEVVFAGKQEPWLLQMIKDFNLEDIVQHIGWLDHNESLNFQSSCDALLLTSSKIPNGKDYSIAGKTFEYFKMGKPILAFVSDGAQKDLLFQSGQAIICNPDDQNSCVIALRNYIDKGIQLNINEVFIDTFKSTETSKQLASVFNEVLALRN